MELYLKMPNEYIQCDITKTYGISRKFYIVYSYIGINRNYLGGCFLTIGRILDCCNIKTKSHKPKSYYEILDVLKYMAENGMIEVTQDLDSISYNTIIDIKILDKFYSDKKSYTTVYYSDIAKILTEPSDTKKDNLILTLLYVSSFIKHRAKDTSGKEKIKSPQKYPEAFYKNLSQVSECIGISKNTLNKCLKELVERGVLVKLSGVRISKDNHLPNIYALNKGNCQQELEWAFDLLKR